MDRITQQTLLLQKIRENPFILAPMAGITDHSFRNFMSELGAGVVITELVSACGIEHRSERTLRLMDFSEKQRPVGIQIFGDDADSLSHAARWVEQLKPDFIDLNFGCPVPKVVKKGGGAAILKDIKKLAQVLNGVVAATQTPITIKVRTGWDENSRNTIEVAHIAYNEGITWMAIHGRTRAQGYSGQSDWEYIAKVKSQSKIPIIGNGDITTAAKAIQRLQQSQCDGVMIGRGCLKNPLIFYEALALYRGLPPPSQFQFMDLFVRLKQELVARCDDYIVQLQLKKFAAWFSSGYPNASQFRKNIFQARTVDETMEYVHNYFENIKHSQKEDTSHEDFLMGGHG